MVVQVHWVPSLGVGGGNTGATNHSLLPLELTPAKLSSVSLHLWQKIGGEAKGGGRAVLVQVQPTWSQDKGKG